MPITKEKFEQEVFKRITKIQRFNGKIWKAGHYKWANEINWEILRMKEYLEQIYGQLDERDEK